MFRLGQLVICIAPRSSLEQLQREIARVDRRDFPYIGSVYTVCGVVTGCQICGDDHVLLEERPGYEFPASWFRACRPMNFPGFVARLFPHDDGRMTG